MTVNEVKPEDKEVVDISDDMSTIGRIAKAIGWVVSVVTDEAVVIMMTLAWIVMVYQEKVVSETFTGAVLLLIGDYIKKEWSTEKK